MSMKQNLWNKTAEVLPGDGQDIVAGLWDVDEDGERVQYIALCYYDAEDKSWYEADYETKCVKGELLKTPDYWIDVPNPE